MTPSSSSLSSPLSSVASRSPSLSVDYPSPASTNTSEPANTPRAHDAPDDVNDPDGPPPAKRQRIMKPRELKTEYLNLSALSESDDEDHHKAHDGKLKKLMEVLRTKKKIVFIAGAGISVSAGIPDFRSSKGLFKTLRTTHKLKASGKHLFDASVYRDDSATSSFHSMVRELSDLTKIAKPTPFHHMLATLAEEGRLMRLYTQNVDGIDTALEPLKTTIPLNIKGPWPKTIQLHGGLEKMVCQKCGHLEDFDASLFDGPSPPACKECVTTDEVRKLTGLRGHGVGRLRPRMVLYNEFNPDEDAIGAVSAADLKSRPDAVIVVGTSLKVPGIRRLAKELCSVTRGRRGGFTAWINHEPEPVGIEFKDCWDMVVRGDCDEVARLLSIPKWDDKDCGDYVLIENGLGKKQTARPEVVVDIKPLTAIKSEGIMTPVDSPREQTPSPTTIPATASTKLKQAPLKFGSVTTAPVEKDTKAKKKPRKPLPTKPTKANNKITNTFTATKTTATKTTKKPVGRPKKQSTDFPNLAPSSISNSKALNTQGNDENVKPQTPKREDVYSVANSSSSQDTISPVSKPSGMAHLIL